MATVIVGNPLQASPAPLQDRAESCRSMIAYRQKFLSLCFTLFFVFSGIVAGAGNLQWHAMEIGLPPNSISGAPASITLENCTGRDVRIYWVKYNGTLQPYGGLKPGEQRVQKTFSNASWLVSNAEGKPLGYFRVPSRGGLAAIPPRTAKPALRSMQYRPGSAAQALAWQKQLRSSLFRLLKLDDLVVLDPAIALQARTLSTRQKDRYALHEIEFNSTAKVRIKAVLTVPTKVKVPCPAVVVIAGHSGTRHSCYKDNGFAAVLAQQGYVTISTRISQHSIREDGRLMMGERLWDLMRCVDLLLSRKEVDRARIGCAGNSLGGEMAMWLGAMDERIAATLSAGFLTRMDQLEQNHCRCWKFPGLRKLVDFSDIYSLNAPRPLMCQNGLKERSTWFTVPLAREALSEIRPAYEDLGSVQNLEFVAHPGGHVIELETMLSFFEARLGK